MRLSRTTGLTLVGLSVAAVGCFIPFGGFGDEEIPFPTVLSTYTTGSAQLVITQSGVAETLSLDRVGRGSALNSLDGAAVSWRTDDGWVLQVTAYEFGSFPWLRPSAAATSTPEAVQGSYSGDITIQRIQASEFWTASGYAMTGNRCIVDIAEATEAGVRGSATCRGLRWADGTAPNSMFNPVYIEGQEPFDAEITFEATP